MAHPRAGSSSAGSLTAHANRSRFSPKSAQMPGSRKPPGSRLECSGNSGGSDCNDCSDWVNRDGQCPCWNRCANSSKSLLFSTGCGPRFSNRVKRPWQGDWHCRFFVLQCFMLELAFRKTIILSWRVALPRYPLRDPGWAEFRVFRWGSLTDSVSVPAGSLGFFSTILPSACTRGSIPCLGDTKNDVRREVVE